MTDERWLIVSLTANETDVGHKGSLLQPHNKRYSKLISSFFHTPPGSENISGRNSIYFYQQKLYRRWIVTKDKEGNYDRNIRYSEPVDC